jgi:hypothetical protein
MPGCVSFFRNMSTPWRLWKLHGWPCPRRVLSRNATCQDLTGHCKLCGPLEGIQVKLNLNGPKA